MSERGAVLTSPRATPELLRVEDLRVAVSGGRAGAPVDVVRGVSFHLGRGEMVGLVGESGCGKTLTALALMRLLPPAATVGGGAVWFAGRDLLRLPEKEMRHLRGDALAMVFQEPAPALNPSFTIGWQIAEAVRAHRPVGRDEARRRAGELLDLVAMPDARRRLDAYPHQLSGGQQQRVMIAMALVGEPRLLLADEPTTALDVTVQAQILDLLERLRRDLGLAVLLVTHDLAVVAETCERVLVMYAGEVVEEAAAGDLFSRPAHPYARALVAALPRLGRRVPRGELPTLPGRVPDPAALPGGCPFHPRCDEAMERCRAEPPPSFTLSGEGASRHARCWLHEPERGTASPEEAV